MRRPTVFTASGAVQVRERVLHGGSHEKRPVRHASAATGLTVIVPPVFRVLQVTPWRLGLTMAATRENKITESPTLEGEPPNLSVHSATQLALEVFQGSHCRERTNRRPTEHWDRTNAVT